MNTPIYDFLIKYIKDDKRRLHMPGHKGKLVSKPLESISEYDITEVRGADSLFHAEDIIRESEQNAASLFQTKHTIYSCGGSTLGIQTMVSLFCSRGEKIIAARNSHVAFINTCALLNLKVAWVLPEYNDSYGVSGEVSAKAIEQAIQNNKDAKCVYITSPDYMGVMSDIKAIAKICKRNKVALLVDNAHGAHLKFMPQDMHPITLGATVCCDSAHKTLPVLTGGAYLHISNESDVEYAQAKQKMSMFGSTSPSYLIMMSLDLCNQYLDCFAKKEFYDLYKKIQDIHRIMREKKLTILGEYRDITKITISCNEVGLSGEQFLQYLDKFRIEPEYVSDNHVVLMLSPHNTDKDVLAVIDLIKSLPKVENNNAMISEKFLIPQTAIYVGDAIFSPCQKISVDNSVGRICAENKITCPPGVPIVVAGEVINEQTKNLLKMSSIFDINVIK